MGINQFRRDVQKLENIKRIVKVTRISLLDMGGKKKKGNKYLLQKIYTILNMFREW